MRQYREAIDWIVRESVFSPVNEIAKGKVVRLVASLARVPPTQVAGDVWKRLKRREVVLASVRAATQGGSPAPVQRVAALAGCGWEPAKREIDALEAEGAVVVTRRRASRAFLVGLREPGHG